MFCWFCIKKCIIWFGRNGSVQVLRLRFNKLLFVEGGDTGNAIFFDIVFTFAKHISSPSLGCWTVSELNPCLGCRFKGLGKNSECFRNFHFYFVIQRTLIINLPHHIILESITHQPGHSHLRFSLEINTSIENSAAALIHQSNSYCN